MNNALASDNPQNSGERTAGVVLILVSVVVFSLAGVFTKGVSTGSWEVIFWRGVFATLFTTTYVIARRQIETEFLKMGRSGIAVGIVGAVGSAFFLSAFKYTSIANVILVYSSAPILASILAWLWIGERVSGKTAIACVAAFAGVAIILQGSFGDSNLFGDLLALGMTICMAILMVLYRRWPKTPAAGPAALSSLLLLPAGYFLGDIYKVSQIDFMILVVFGLTFAIASVTLGEGMKRIPAGEAALLSILETPLAPILGFAFFAEVPPLATFVGGGLVLVAVVWSQMKNGEDKWQAEKS